MENSTGKLSTRADECVVGMPVDQSVLQGGGGGLNKTTPLGLQYGGGFLCKAGTRDVKGGAWAGATLPSWGRGGGVTGNGTRGDKIRRRVPHNSGRDGGRRKGRRVGGGRERK